MTEFVYVRPHSRSGTLTCAAVAEIALLYRSARELVADLEGFCRPRGARAQDGRGGEQPG